jgi:hypothetical protein
LCVFEKNADFPKRAFSDFFVPAAVLYIISTLRPGFASCGYADLFNGSTLEVDLTLPLVNPPIEQGLSGNFS